MAIYQDYKFCSKCHVKRNKPGGLNIPPFKKRVNTFLLMFYIVKVNMYIPLITYTLHNVYTSYRTSPLKTESIYLHEYNIEWEAVAYNTLKLYRRIYSAAFTARMVYCD